MAVINHFDFTGGLDTAAAGSSFNGERKPSVVHSQVVLNPLDFSGGLLLTTANPGFRRLKTAA